MRTAHDLGLSFRLELPSFTLGEAAQSVLQTVMQAAFLESWAFIAQWRAETGGAFTLLEFLVVTAILAILAATFLTAPDRAKREVHRASCASTPRQMSYAPVSCAEGYNELLPYVNAQLSF